MEEIHTKDDCLDLGGKNIFFFFKIINNYYFVIFKKLNIEI